MFELHSDNVRRLSNIAYALASVWPHVNTDVLSFASYSLATLCGCTARQDKMAEGVVLSGVPSRVLPNDKGKVSEYACNKCSIYENQLKEALEELESTRIIIDILRS